MVVSTKKHVFSSTMMETNGSVAEDDVNMISTLEAKVPRSEQLNPAGHKLDTQTNKTSLILIKMNVTLVLPCELLDD